MISSNGPLIEPDSLLKIATEAEALGFDYVTVSDHVMIPTSIASRYPYSDSGEFPSGAAALRLEFCADGAERALDAIGVRSAVRGQQDNEGADDGAPHSGTGTSKPFSTTETAQ